MPRGRRPPAVMHDDGLRLLPGALQPVEVLMMMERIAARPVHQPDVGIGVAPSVEGVAFARTEQHVGNARDRDHGARRIERQWDLRTCDVDTRDADAVGGAVSKREPGPRLAYLRASAASTIEAQYGCSP